MVVVVVLLVGVAVVVIVVIVIVMLILVVGNDIIDRCGASSSRGGTREAIALKKCPP